MAKKSALTKQLIIDAALPIFNTKGYIGTSISDITKATKITKGAIYGNFKNKDEVVSSAFEKGVSIVLNEIAQRIKTVNTAPEKLITLVNYYGEYVKNPPIPGGCPVLNSSIEADDGLPFLRAKVVRSISLIKDSLIKIVHRGIVEGQIKKSVDPEGFAICFYSMIEGAISLSRIEGDDRSFQFVRTQLIQQIKEISN